LSGAEKRLLDSGIRTPDAQTLLEPAHARWAMPDFDSTNSVVEHSPVS
jgi:hypothetical protein